MGKFIDLMGQQFGRLIVIERKENDKGGRVRWLCQCKCGKDVIVQSGPLNSGATKSCGCLKQELLKLNPHNLRHGHRTNSIISKTYKAWADMIQRCNNPNNTAYKNYGGRGICVCKAWMKFERFLQDMGERPPNLTLDRIDNNGDYCKENCRWTTIKEQRRNYRQNRLITINGITKCLIEWCEDQKLNYHTVWMRIYQYNWTPEEALELIPRKKKCK